jgi:hypothetical protein
VDTLYPFSDSVAATVTADRAFTYMIRVPSWVTNGTIAINGGNAQPLKPTNGFHAVSVASGTTKFAVELPAPITLGILIVAESESRLTHFTRVSPPWLGCRPSRSASLCIRYPEVPKGIAPQTVSWLVNLRIAPLGSYAKRSTTNGKRSRVRCYCRMAVRH